ncbi:hypothetical protein AM592_15465 [Bacillus gobiensis]|uniref:Uncharacterized protein n=2 Tax=Bacillus TaxID=1386 RepID=A0A0M4FVY8_9BACI|nr:hypothetical protein AM592_15465 [Bacillus gobiensis]MBP1081793.1 hypothetical protein [Bacillus capparidis]
MGKFSQKLLKYWLSIPRWFKVFILSSFTICFIWILFVKGINTLLDFRLDLAELIIFAIAAAVVLYIFNRKKE